MCCFSGNINRVWGTKIFASKLRENRQCLVYSMSLDTKRDVAMILPIPVQRKVGVKSLEFVSLQQYPDFFKDMASGFPPIPTKATLSAPAGAANGPKVLEVVNVGSFEASFVPKTVDFDRLDARFRLPQGVWDNIPTYKNYGFAVFKLKSGSAKVHPMAFTFLSAVPDRLFFPTMHIHDGKVHKTAIFDHQLFCQRAGISGTSLHGWRESPGHANSFMKLSKTKGLVLPDQHCYLLNISNRKNNQDYWV